MRQAIRALGWAANIFWMILLFFTATAVYSAFQLGPGFGEPYTSALDGAPTVSLPFYIYNGGFYDISNLTLRTLIKDKSGLLISNSSTPPQLIPHGSNVSVTYNISINFGQMTTDDLSHLLLNDSVFDFDVFLGLNYANAVPLQISTNLTMPWGAPLYNLTILSPTSVNSTHISVPISFENHSPFSLDGTMRLELVDSVGHLLGSGVASISVPSQSVYSSPPFVVSVSDPINIRKARLLFDTSVFSFSREVALHV